MNTEKAVLYPEDISKLTGIGLNCIYRQLRAKKILHIRVGDRYLISKSNYEAWINGQQASQQKVGTNV